MKKICIRSLILGVGIGLVLVASFNLLLQQQSSTLLSNSIEETNSSNYEQALQNMKTGINNQSSGNNINAPEVKEEEKVVPEVAEADKEKANPEVADNEKVNPELAEEEDAPIEIKIDKGMASEAIANLLFEKGAIENPKDFIDLAIELKMTKQFKYGLKQIPRGSTLKEVIEILTKIE